MSKEAESLMKIKFVIERLEGGKALLRDERGRLIVWPRDYLPAAAGEKDFFNVETEETAGGGADGKSAKDILNEILNPE